MPTTKKCPECDAEIDYLKFESDVTQYGTEWGTADLDGDNHDYTDSEFNDGNTEGTRYSCPECDATLDPEDLIDIDDEDEDEEVETVKVPPPVEGTENHPAVEPPDVYGGRTAVTMAICPQCGSSRDTDPGEQQIICHRCDHEYPLETNKQVY